MILYTYQAQNLIFPASEEEFTKQQTIPVAGGSLVVEAVNASEGPGKYRVVRLLSTDPNMYLHSHYQPGSLLDPINLNGGLE
ncbi:YlzJ-like family protein [Alteribacter keqinensis]|uniref:Ribonuclease n=1 Tax=Alteribacter keqinensis TaxID=2483800 RepID=A0A3M7TXA6_9BACI|nr:YlzJ-like family protein [Alteribacter keqinensis]RNA69532.1 ribonuclease [Alteribacter keqinensis]